MLAATENISHATNQFLYETVARQIFGKKAILQLFTQ